MQQRNVWVTVRGTRQGILARPRRAGSGRRLPQVSAFTCISTATLCGALSGGQARCLAHSNAGFLPEWQLHRMAAPSPQSAETVHMTVPGSVKSIFFPPLYHVVDWSRALILADNQWRYYPKGLMRVIFGAPSFLAPQTSSAWSSGCLCKTPAPPSGHACTSVRLVSAR